MSRKPTIQTEDKYVIRFPEGMRDQLKAAAEKNNRSMNAEIVARLDQSFAPPPDADALTAAYNLVEQMREQVARYEQHLVSVEEEFRQERQKFREEQAKKKDLLLEDVRSREERLREREMRASEREAASREKWEDRLAKAEARAKELDSAIERVTQREKEFAAVIESLSRTIDKG